jgi:hypothetical protein
VTGSSDCYRVTDLYTIWTEASVTLNDICGYLICKVSLFYVYFNLRKGGMNNEFQVLSYNIDADSSQVLSVWICSCYGKDIQK